MSLRILKRKHLLFYKYRPKIFTARVLKNDVFKREKTPLKAEFIRLFSQRAYPSFKNFFSSKFEEIGQYCDLGARVCVAIQRRKTKLALKTSVMVNFMFCGSRS